MFLAICERVIDGAESYEWVKYIYIDDPITSLDDNNAIAVASDLAKLLRKAKGRTKQCIAVSADGERAEWKVVAPIRAVVSSHHALFFNVVCNELKNDKPKKYFLHRPERGDTYTLRATDDTPFFHHVAIVGEEHEAGCFAFHASNGENLFATSFTHERHDGLAASCVVESSNVAFWFVEQYIALGTCIDSLAIVLHDISGLDFVTHFGNNYAVNGYDASLYEDIRLAT